MDGGEDMNDETAATLGIDGITSFAGNAAKNSSGGERASLVFVFLPDTRAIAWDGLVHAGKRSCHRWGLAQCKKNTVRLAPAHSTRGLGT